MPLYVPPSVTQSVSVIAGLVKEKEKEERRIKEVLKNKS